MTARLELIRWTDQRPILDIIEDAKKRGVPYLTIGGSPNRLKAEVIEQVIQRNPSSDVIAFVDANQPARDPRITALLPPVISLIAAPPDQDFAIAILIQSISLHSHSLERSQSLREFVIRLAETCSVSFNKIETDGVAGYAIPGLTTRAVRHQLAGLRDLIERIHVPNAKTVAMTSLRAGLFLLSDLFDESHSCSQSIEGEGRYHTGDYWHAILHRREPDYGNSKYWFRRVGSHPVFVELAKTIDRDRPPVSSGEGVLAQARSRVVVNGAWDPYAFVDVCAAAEADRNLTDWCERVQYREMLLLLEHSYRESAGLELL